MSARLVIRYYPVEPLKNWGPPLGLSLWITEELDRDDEIPHTMSVESGHDVFSSPVTEQNESTGNESFASATHFDAYGSSPGDYIEREINLFSDSTGAVQEITPTMFPLECYLAGLGHSVEKSEGDIYEARIPLVDGAPYDSTYSGGVVEIGAYLDGPGGLEYQPLASFWFVSENFSDWVTEEDYLDLGSAGPVTEVDNSSGSPKITLSLAGGPPIIEWRFWTGNERSEEVPL